MATLTRKALITEEEFLALKTRAYVIDGELTTMSPNKVNHSFYGLRIGSYLNAFVHSRKLGRAFGDNGAYIPEKDKRGGLKNALVPDASFVSYEKLPPDASINRTLPFAPTLAIEVISDSEEEEDIQEKVDKYLKFGTQLIWLVYTTEQQIHVITPDNRAGTRLKIEDTLTGGTVLPGFEVSLQAIFDENDSALYVQTLQKLLTPPEG